MISVYLIAVKNLTISLANNVFHASFHQLYTTRGHVSVQKRLLVQQKIMKVDLTLNMFA